MDHGGVSADRHTTRLGYGERLLASKSFHIARCGLVGSAGLVYIMSPDGELETDLAQQVGPAPRTRCQNQLHNTLPRRITLRGCPNAPSSSIGLASKNTALAGAPTSKKSTRPVAR